jgi:AcrR family transcriptional regulator
MTQHTVFSREMIIEAAFNLTREKGWAKVTARNIAKALGSSTMPLYSSLKSMEGIEKGVIDRAMRLMQDYQRRAYTDNGLLNSAIGYVTFARDEAQLFRFLFVDRPDAAPPIPVREPQNRPLPSPEDVQGLYDLQEQPAVAVQDPFVLKNWVFVHGLASLISSRVIELTDERIIGLIEEAAMSFYMSNDAVKAMRKEENHE